MTIKTERAGIQIDVKLAEFLETEVLAPLGRDAAAFWSGFAALLADFAPRNRALLEKREDLQARIDAALPKLFDVMPKANYEVRAVEAFRAQSSAGAS